MGLLSAGRLVGFGLLSSLLLVAAPAAAAQGLTTTVPDLTISEAVTPAQVPEGGLVSYTATVRSAAAATTNVAVWMSVPVGVSLLPDPYAVISDSEFTCAVDGSWVKCTGGAIAPHAPGTITVRGTVESHAAAHLFWLAAVDPEDLVAERDDLNNSAIVSARVVDDLRALAADPSDLAQHP